MFVDDTKVRQRVNKEEDIELMQVELDKLYQWGINNNKEFNRKHFQVIRYGRNVNLKKNTEYLVGDYQEEYQV